MLKPKKKITKKEIKKDPVLEKVANTYGFVKEKHLIIIKISLGVAIGIILFLVWSSHKDKLNLESNLALSKALISWQTDDLDNAKLQFEILADEFKNTSNGKLANYWLGLIEYNSGNKELAEAYLKKIISYGQVDIILPNAYKVLAHLSWDKNDKDKAQTYFQKAVKYSLGGNDKLNHKLNLVDFYISQEKFNEANDLLEPILETKDLSSALKIKAEELTGKLN